MNKDIANTKALAESHGLKFKDCSNGHVQIEGHGIQVNYWPNSKKRTACVKNGESVLHCSPWDAVRLAMVSGKPGLKPKNKNISKNGPDFKVKSARTNPAGIKHFYAGNILPWEFPTFIMCQSDRLRIAAYKTRSRADQMDFREAN